MAVQTEKQSRFKRLTNRYRLVIMNDHTYEEVVTFKITRISVYVVSCFLFVLLVGLTSALIVFTPMKYYIPGFGNQTQRKELTLLRIRTDSLEKQMRFREAYWNSVRDVLAGKSGVSLDTNSIIVPNLEQSKD